jgi:hypothetical protein
MENTALLGWLSLDRLLYSLLRVAFVWLAFHGAGSLILRIGDLRRQFLLLPAIVPGMLLYMLLVCILSSVRLLTRSVVPLFLIPGALSGAIFLYPRLKKAVSGITVRRENLLLLPILILAVFIVTTDFMIAGRPDINIDDPQVTYTVQPDRWLNEGRISVLDETIFSGLPMTSEMISVMPLSMSEDRLDQLILSQIFQMSMLFAAIISGFGILRLGKKFLPAAVIGIGGCSILVIWAQFAKPDSTALFFTTVALCILLRQLADREHGSDLSAFLPMGMAMATKPTAYLALVPFAAMLFMLMERDKWKVSKFLWGILLMSILPLIFAFRTVGLTGSPFYPFASIRMLLKPEWVKPAIDMTFFDVMDRSSRVYEHFSIIENVWHYFRTWEAAIFLLMGGFILSIKRTGFRQRVAILAAIGAYSLLSLILFYPAWWGAKYGIMLIPFAALFGLHMLKRLKRGLLLASCIAAAAYLVFDTSISPTEHYSVGYRFSLIESYSTGKWSYERFPCMVIEPELYSQIWMNGHIPEGSTVLSLFDQKRYLSNHRYIVAWRYPLAARLFLENTLEDELDILVELGVDYIVCRTVDPVPFDGENNLEILSVRGIGNILEPVAEINGHTVYRFEPRP